MVNKKRLVKSDKADLERLYKNKRSKSQGTKFSTMPISQKKCTLTTIFLLTHTVVHSYSVGVVCKFTHFDWLLPIVYETVKDGTRKVHWLAYLGIDVSFPYISVLCMVQDSWTRYRTQCTWYGAYCSDSFIYFQGEILVNFEVTIVH